MESYQLFVEVDSEEIQGPLSISNGGGIAPQYLVEVVSSFGSYRADLLVAAGVARYEEDRNALYSCVLIHASFSI